MKPAIKGLFSKNYTPISFPNLQSTPYAEDMVAFNGDLSSNLLIEAYAKGIFPWYNQNPIRWYSPCIRMLLFPGNFKENSSFKKFLKKIKNWKIKIDQNFEKVIESCALTPRKDNPGTWINADMRLAYKQLHKIGICHSIEVWEESIPSTNISNSNNGSKQEILIGGLYGVSLGKAFFGESMFSLRSNASKVALYALHNILLTKKFHYIDCQVPSQHLINLGATVLERQQFLQLLEKSNSHKTHIGSWQSWENLFTFSQTKI